MPPRLLPDLTYRSGAPRPLRLDLALPEPHAGLVPLVVRIHGGGWMGGDKADLRALDLRLAAAGLMVASVQHRFSTEAPFPAPLEDVAAAVAWLLEHAGDYGPQPDRLGMWGHSSGGHLAALYATSTFGQAGAVTAAATVSAPVDLLTMGGWHDAPDSPESLLLGGPVQARRDLALAANPLSYVAAGAPPFLVIHGDRDEVVPFGQAVTLAHGLEAAGAEVPFQRVAGADHAFSQPPGAWAAVEAAVADFFRVRLLGN